MAGNRTVKKCWDLEKDKAYNLEHGKLMGLHHTTGSCCSACFSLGSVIVCRVTALSLIGLFATMLRIHWPIIYPPPTHSNPI